MPGPVWCIARRQQTYDRLVLDRFGAGRELADGDTEVAVNHPALWRPLIHLRLLVVKPADARREAKHRQDASVRQPLAQRKLGERGVAERVPNRVA